MRVGGPAGPPPLSPGRSPLGQGELLGGASDHLGVDRAGARLGAYRQRVAYHRVELSHRSAGRAVGVYVN